VVNFPRLVSCGTSVFHTLLPLFGLESPLYDERLDLMAACRGA
jgi:hypothetical protein